MKKFHFLAMATILASTVAAHADGYLTGWYGGMQGGIQTLTARETGNINTINKSHTNGHTGGIVGLFGGYGHMISDWYVAAQLQGDLGNFNNKSDTSFSASGLSTSVKSHLRTQSLWGATGLLGYQVVKDTVAYVGAGVDYARWRYSENTLGSKRSNQLGFAPRLGFRTLIAKNIFLNAEYKHSFFRKITLASESSTLSAKPRVQTFTIGFALKTNG